MAKKNNDFDYPTAVARLGEILQKIQQDDTPIEESYLLFKQGNALIEQCRAYLDQTELKVQQLIDGRLADFE
ncbi:MAG: exodeoxyribonuclease VII small subunit [Bacteroidetes bacterium]|jgi:exodeoxyribonuclease VII small subunit|nr:exodeoxyribonuclease VII small subunit [Bacteroidota bacterium]